LEIAECLTESICLFEKLRLRRSKSTKLLLQSTDLLDLACFQLLLFFEEVLVRIDVGAKVA